MHKLTKKINIPTEIYLPKQNLVLVLNLLLK